MTSTGGTRTAASRAEAGDGSPDGVVPADRLRVVVGRGPVSPSDVVAVARSGAGVRLSDDALAEMARSRAVVEALADDPQPHYGVSTGFGALATRHIPVHRRGPPPAGGGRPPPARPRPGGGGGGGGARVVLP